MSTVRIAVLGPVSVTSGGRELDLQRGQRQLLAVLVAAGPEGLSLDQLADELWGERLPSGWKQATRMAVSRLRRRTGLALPLRNGRYQLDVEPSAVDAWRLIDAATDGPIDETVIDLATQPVVLPDVELSPAVRRLVTMITTAQRSIAVRLCSGPSRPDGATSMRLRRLGARAASDPELARALAVLGSDPASQPAPRPGSGPASGGDAPGRDGPDRAGGVIDGPVGAGAARLPAPDLLPRQLRRRPQRVLAGRDDELSVLRAVAGLDPPIATTRPAGGVDAAAPSEELDRSTPPSGVLVLRGVEGIGKTAVLNQLARTAAGQGVQVLFGAGSAGGSVAYGPLVGAVPGFGRRISEVVAEAPTAEIVAARLVDAFVTEVEAVGRGRRCLLLVDDAQWLDGPSCEVLDTLARSTIPGPRLTIMLAARPVRGGRTPWAGLQVRLDQLGHAHLELDGLSLDAIIELVAERRPGLSLAARAHLGSWLVSASGGRPIVVEALLAEADGTSPTGGDETDVFDRIVESVDPDTRLVGGAAAVLGAPFELSGLGVVAGRSEETVLDAIDRLVDRDLVIETEVLDRFEFAHQLIADAFARSVSQSRRARFHARAAEHTGDVHRRAHHLVGAGPLADREEARRATVDSALTHLASNAYWEAATAFRSGLPLAGAAGPEATVLIGYARALALSGDRSGGREVRRRAFELAAAGGDWDLALDAATVALPEAELPDGEPDRYRDVAAIPPESLDGPRRFEQAVTAARLASFLGRPDEAQVWAGAAGRLAADDRQRIQAALGYRFATTVLAPPGERAATLDRAVEGVPTTPFEQCRVEQFRALDLLEQGAVAEAALAHGRFRALALQVTDPVRQWHAEIFGSLLAELDGRWGDADRLADGALDTARRAGVDQADVARLSQVFFRLETTGQLDLLMPGLEDVPVADRDSLLFLSARARILDAGGRRADARQVAESIAAQTLNARSATSLTCLAIAAPLLAPADAGLRRRVRDVLEPFRDSLIVVGVGFGIVGPVDLLIAQLDGRDLVAAVGDAIAWSDRAGIRSWQVRHRLDHAALTGSDDLRVEAAGLARGTSLEEMAPPVDTDGQG